MIHKPDLEAGITVEHASSETQLFVVKREFKVHARSALEAERMLDQQLDDAVSAMTALTQIARALNQVAAENAELARREQSATSLPAGKDDGAKDYGPN